MKVTRIHYTGGLSQERFLENLGGKRKPTLLRVKALMSEQAPEIQTRTFGLVLEAEDEEATPNLDPANKAETKKPLLTLVRGGNSNSDS